MLAPAASPSPKSPTADDLPRGRSAPRSKKGCWTCRERKVKCDEKRPACQRCTQAHRECTYVIPEGRRKRVYAVQLLPTGPDTPQTENVDVPHSSGLPLPGDGVEVQVTSAASSSEGPDENRILAFYQQQYLSAISTKSPQWSFFSGIVHLGRTNSALINLLLANARYQASALEKREEERLEALEHYQSGLRDFVSLVSSGQFDPLTLLSTLFLLVQFEIRHAERAEDVRSHFEGFIAAVITHGDQLVPALRPFMEGAPNTWPAGSDITLRFHNVLNRLALWIAYVDAVASSWDLGGSVMEMFWNRFPGSFEMMFAKSRDALKEIWSQDYPPNEALDDLQNRPAFDLFHESHLLRYRVSLFRWSLGDPEKAGRLHAEIKAKIESLNQQHAVLVDIASKWPNAKSETPRIVLNLRFIVPFFHAVQIEFYQAASHGMEKSPLLQRSLSAVLQIAAIVHENEQPSSMCRIAWPLFVAGVETVDFAHQSWVLERFQSISDFSLSFRRAHELLKAVILHQRQTGEKVDYRRWVHSRSDFPTFII